MSKWQRAMGSTLVCSGARWKVVQLSNMATLARRLAM
ncbi:Uncharacterised protein [Vibrio cholerae]|nr:Uncharacterised protein [Vibrio cholerae]